MAHGPWPMMLFLCSTLLHMALPSMYIGLLAGRAVQYNTPPTLSPSLLYEFFFTLLFLHE